MSAVGGSDEGRKAQRKAAMAVLAHATSEEIAGHLAAIPLPAHENLRDAENGLVMLRGRIGGDGAPFNLGEATVSRAAVRLASGEVGFGYTLGRDHDKARMIALCDALGACPSNDWSSGRESDSLRSHEQGISALEDR